MKVDWWTGGQERYLLLTTVVRLLFQLLPMNFSPRRESHQEKAVACHASYIEHCTGTYNKGRAVRVCVYMCKKVVPL